MIIALIHVAYSNQPMLNDFQAKSIIQYNIRHKDFDHVDFKPIMFKIKNKFFIIQ